MYRSAGALALMLCGCRPAPVSPKHVPASSVALAPELLVDVELDDFPQAPLEPDPEPVMQAHPPSEEVRYGTSRFRELFCEGCTVTRSVVVTLPRHQPLSKLLPPQFVLADGVVLTLVWEPQL